MTKWKLDPCQEGGGGWTIRVDDGSEHGAIDCDPVATFNDGRDAELCIRAVGAHGELVSLLHAYWLDQSTLREPFRNQGLFEQADKLLKELGR